VQPKIILASNSPGRKMLFEKYFKDFLIIPSNFDENNIKDNDPVKLTELLAFKKCEEVAKNNPYDFVFAFDTVVLCENHIIGKPQDRDDARKMLKFLSGKKQIVISGYSFALYHKNIFSRGHEKTILYFDKLTDDFIEEYISTHDVLKYAGGYAIQENDRFLNIEEGDIDVVIGAPMKKVKEFLLKNNFQF
jgi:septum formation protein